MLAGITTASPLLNVTGCVPSHSITPQPSAATSTCALLAPGSVRSAANGASASSGHQPAEVAAASLAEPAEDPVAVEDPVEPGAGDRTIDLSGPESPHAATAVAEERPTETVLAGPDPVLESVDDGRPQRRRRRATRP